MDQKSHQVPEDVIIEILLRLPVKSLVRFRSVCVCWSSLIRNPFFVNLHLKRVTTSNPLKRGFLLHRRLHEPSKYILSILCYNDNIINLYTDIEVLDFVGPPKAEIGDPRVERDIRDLEVLGSCNGIICLGNCLNYYMLVNPGTRERKILPHPPEEDTKYPNDVGFGFDSKNNDYKLVRLFKKIVHLYSLRSNSWRRLKVDGLPLKKLDFTPTCGRVCIKGVCHWIGKTFNYNLSPLGITKYTVVSFDFTNEVLRFAPLPVPIDYSDERIIEWNGSVGVFGYEFFPKEKSFHIWRMEEYGAHESFTKLPVVGQIYEERFTPMGFWKHENLLFLGQDDGYLISYNLTTQEFTNHHIHIRGWGGFGTWTETLVSIQDHVGN